MFGARHAAKRYLDLIAPWAGNEWDSEKINSKEFREEKLQPDWVQFKIPQRPLPGWFEQLLLGPEASGALINLIGCVSRFNDVVDEIRALNRGSVAADKLVVRLKLHGILHAMIGTPHTNGMNAAFIRARGSI